MITINKLNKYYANSKKAEATHVIKDLSLTINKGDFASIMGKSGCGKTTLLNIIGCLETFESGMYSFGNSDIRQLNEKEKARLRNTSIGFVFQAFNLIGDLTVYENIEMPLGLAKVPKKEIESRVLELTRSLDIIDLIRNKPSELSGGQQQRVAIARALVNNPSVLLADEPTGNLDIESGKRVMDLLKHLNTSLGTTIVLVTHDPEIATYSDYVIHMKDGEISRDSRV